MRRAEYSVLELDSSGGSQSHLQYAFTVWLGLIMVQSAISCSYLSSTRRRTEGRAEKKAAEPLSDATGREVPGECNVNL